MSGARAQPSRRRWGRLVRGRGGVAATRIVHGRGGVAATRIKIVRAGATLASRAGRSAKSALVKFSIFAEACKQAGEGAADDANVQRLKDQAIRELRLFSVDVPAAERKSCLLRLICDVLQEDGASSPTLQKSAATALVRPRDGSSFAGPEAEARGAGGGARPGHVRQAGRGDCRQSLGRGIEHRTAPGEFKGGARGARPEGGVRVSRQNHQPVPVPLPRVPSRRRVAAAPRPRRRRGYSAAGFRRKALAGPRPSLGRRSTA